MRFREFRLDDFDAVIHLWTKAGLILSRSDTIAGMINKMKRDPELFFVLEKADQMIGVVMGSYDGRRGWINHLAVDPDYQGQKLGQKIMEELESRFKQAGCEKVNLLIERDMQRSKAFMKSKDIQEMN